MISTDASHLQINVDGTTTVLVDSPSLAIPVPVEEMLTKTAEAIVQTKEDNERKPTGNVKVPNWSSSAIRDSFVFATEDILLPTIKHEIILKIPTGHACLPFTRDEKIRIFLNSIDPGSLCSRATVPDSIFGFKIQSSGSYYQPRASLIADFIVDGDWTVASVVGSNLFIHHNIYSSDDRDNIELYKLILAKFLKIINISHKDRLAARLALYKNTDKELDFYKKLKIQGSTKRKQAVESEIKKKLQSVQDLQKRLIATTKAVLVAELELETINSVISQVNEKELLKDIDAISAIPGVKEFFIENDIVHVHTEYIKIPVKAYKKEYGIGEFEILINFNPNSWYIKFLNLTKRGRAENGYGHHHPHVRPSGKPCLGNISDLIPDLLASYDVQSIIVVALEYLRSVNLRDVGVNVKNGYWDSEPIK